MDPTLIGQGLLSGFLFGGVYSLMAVGLTLIFGVMRVVNFAHGDMMVWGMYLAWLLASRAGIDPYVGFGVCAAALFLFGFAVQRGLVDRIVDAIKKTNYTAGLMQYAGPIVFNEIGDNPNAVTTMVQILGQKPVAVWPKEAAVQKFVFPRPKR